MTRRLQEFNSARLSVLSPRRARWVPLLVLGAVVLCVLSTRPAQARPAHTIKACVEADLLESTGKKKKAKKARKRCKEAIAAAKAAEKKKGNKPSAGGKRESNPAICRAAQVLIDRGQGNSDAGRARTAACRKRGGTVQPARNAPAQSTSQRSTSQRSTSQQRPTPPRGNRGPVIGAMSSGLTQVARNQAPSSRPPSAPPRPRRTTSPGPCATAQKLINKGQGETDVGKRFARRCIASGGRLRPATILAANPSKGQPRRPPAPCQDAKDLIAQTRRWNVQTRELIAQCHRTPLQKPAPMVPLDEGPWATHWTRELPSTQMVKDALKGTDDADTVARQQAAYVTLTDYIAARENQTQMTPQLAADRSREYMREWGTSLEPTPTAPSLSYLTYTQSVDFREETLSQFINPRSLAAYKRTPEYARLKSIGVENPRMERAPVAPAPPPAAGPPRVRR